MYDCEKNGHITKITEWEYVKVDGDVVSKASFYGCTKCDATSKDVFPGFGGYVMEKEPCEANCWCFACKIQTLQLNTGDASRDIPDKKWRAKLDNYKKAREQGMQPGGTSPAHVEAAYKASETLGKAYQADSMPKAHMINKRIAEVVNSGILDKE